ncbi:hypothetical protein HZA97_07960 [Candidatus Woesearchaeota archaeon]|nr:hypothetical protein [Candidatus Woesearchaeota archaeon]
MPENSLIDNELFIISLFLIGTPLIIIGFVNTNYYIIPNFSMYNLFLALPGFVGIIVFICVLTYLILKIFHLVQYLFVRRKIISLKQKEQTIKTHQENHIAKLSEELDKIFLEAKPLLKAENTFENKQKLEEIQKELLQSKFKDLELHKKRIQYVQQIGEKVREIEIYLKSKEKEILGKEEQRLKELKAECGYVKGAKLSDWDKELLLKRGFAKLQCNEFCGRGNPVYFLKPRDKETPEHFFLVRHTQEYLENKGITATTPEKRDADVIFEINGVTYAIEVETGTYPEKKPEEFENKIKQCNDKYGNNWMFLVVHRDLISFYKKYNAKTYHREQMVEVLDVITSTNHINKNN